MKLLILGGGVFLGAATLDAALARGHAVTVFNRGRSRTAWPGGVEVLVGDRTTDLSRARRPALGCVIDCCGYVPADVQASAEALRDGGSYLFVSRRVGLRLDAATRRWTETDAVASAEGIARDDRDLTHYGPAESGLRSRGRARVRRARADRQAPA